MVGVQTKFNYAWVNTPLSSHHSCFAASKTNMFPFFQ